MIHDAARLGSGQIDADLCVVGSGPGGLTAATMAAEAGLRVICLEAGGLITPAQMTQREEQMLPRLMWASGARTTADRAVRVLQGKGVGGSSLHNINLCKRIPHPILRRWIATRGLSHLPLDRWDALYTEVEALLTVRPIPARLRSPHNRLLQAGCEALGWAGGGLAHNRTGCLASGFCEIGCAFDAKNNALKVFAPRFVRAGGTILTHAQAIRVRHAAGRVSGVEAVIRDPVDGTVRGRLVVRAPRICLAASATGTPAILLRSGIPDPSGETGRTLRLHPAVVVAGDFAEPVNAWQGIPQAYECTEWLDFEAETARTWIVPVFGHPMGVATLVPGAGAAHRARMERFAHTAALTAMLHDHTCGVVTPAGELGVRIDYWPDAADRAELAQGLARCGRLLFAAGAQSIFVPAHPTPTLLFGEDPARLALTPIERGRIDLSAVHPMASVPMGDDPQRAAVDSRGRHHHLKGLWISDGSLLCSSIGVPPQLSIYALGLHVGRALAEQADP